MHLGGMSIPIKSINTNHITLSRVGVLHPPPLKLTTSSLCQIISSKTVPSVWDSRGGSYGLKRWLPPSRRSTLCRIALSSHNSGWLCSDTICNAPPRNPGVGTLLDLMDWPHKPPHVFSARFVLTHVLPGKLPRGSPILEFLQAKHA